MNALEPICQIGMTVRLRSGGPLLTVNSIPNEKGYVLCVWFDKDRHLGREEFHLAALEMAMHEDSAVDEDIGASAELPKVKEGAKDHRYEDEESSGDELVMGPDELGTDCNGEPIYCSTRW
jgi:uncharacterized protein YodC (DUF2158 family)